MPGIAMGSCVESTTTPRSYNATELSELLTVAQLVIKLSLSCVI